VGGRLRDRRARRHRDHRRRGTRRAVAEGWADVLLLAPATANTAGKVAAAVDDTPVTTCATTALGADLPVVMAPAMHEPMYDHPGVLEALDRLEAWGVTFADPRIEEGKAKIAAEEDIVTKVARATTPQSLGDARRRHRGCDERADRPNSDLDEPGVGEDGAGGRSGAVRPGRDRDAGTGRFGGPLRRRGRGRDRGGDDGGVSPDRGHRGRADLRGGHLLRFYRRRGRREDPIRIPALGRSGADAEADRLGARGVPGPDLPIVGFKAETSGDDAAMVAEAERIRDRVGLVFVVANDASVMGTTRPASSSSATKGPNRRRPSARRIPLPGRSQTGWPSNSGGRRSGRIDPRRQPLLPSFAPKPSWIQKLF